MYAAAGGASLASRQARQRQRQQKRNQQLQAKLHPPKLSALSTTEHGASTPTRTQSRQFHQLPTNYLRTPQTQIRKLSASYTTQSKLLLPIEEGDNQSVLQMRMQYVHPSTNHSHSHAHPTQTHPHSQYQSAHQQYHSHGGISQKLIHRHSGSGASTFHQPKLSKSATATLPLVSQMEATPPSTPSGAAEGATTTATKVGTSSVDHTCINLSHHDTIIVTPATPMASPGHVGKPLHKQQEALTGIIGKIETSTSPSAIIDYEEQMKNPPLERKCSVYRMRRNEPYEYKEASIGGGVGSSVRRQLKDLKFNQQQQYEPLLSNESHLCYKGLANGRKWQVCAYCEEGICVCEHIECTRGRAAWLERGRRCSVQEAQQQAACHRRWVKRNRIQDASLGGSSDDEDLLGVLRGPSTFANAFLYVGLGTIALGLVIAFVGTGEKGFKTVELRLIGPSLIGLGFICCMLRILFCICPSHCISTNKNNFKKDCNKIDADYTTSLLRGEGKRVSIARRPGLQPKYPLAHKRSNNKILNEGMEALRQIATTSLFMQNEQKPSLNRVVPIIKEPENIGEHIPKKTEFSSCDDIYDTNHGEKTGTYKEVDSEDTNKAGVEDIINTTTTAIKVSSAESTVNTPSNEASETNLVSKSAVLLEQKIPAFSSTPISEALTISPTSKLSRQRIAMNHKLLQQAKPHINDSDLLMETSMSIIQSSTTVNEFTLRNGSNSDTMNNAYIASAFIDKTSTGAVPRTTTSDTALSTPPTSERTADLNSISEIGNISSSIVAARTNSSSTAPSIPPFTLSLNKSICPSVQSIFIPGQIEDMDTATSEQSLAIAPSSTNLRAFGPGISNARFMLPSPLSSSSDSESEGSSAFSPSQATVMQALSKSEQSPSDSAAANVGISHSNKYAPQNHPVNIFEPELLLSPAKLCQ
ncbi:uncharacterized protein LOC128865043 [Anastrepha ludens]|uniref:uncharacterized protein LOC128865043 n=1 Tax=Anastrepha ludens TaxID=28586 RepID=UPI0023AFA6A0|nr:uncharacterized protein LOC128865043 [Anastrepha ludens]XP_053960912.1 uncharacterized protein LOC128865043 [Anastrepha ludens]XP_053960913.1 uncharacterized protein LOC128865043 [Anastrepha ludens]